MPHGASWSRISSRLSSAPAATARSMKPSGSSTKTSTRIVLVPTEAGVPSVVRGLAQEEGCSLDGQAPRRCPGSTARWLLVPVRTTALPPASGTASISEIAGWPLIYEDSPAAHSCELPGPPAQDTRSKTNQALPACVHDARAQCEVSGDTRVADQGFSAALDHPRASARARLRRVRRSRLGCG